MNKINTFIIGAGAREHALAWKCRQSPFCGKLHINPGNPAIDTIARSIIYCNADEIREIGENLDLFIIGPEDEIVAGKTYEAFDAGFKVFAPATTCAELESNKSLAKDIMTKVGIPTADYQVSTDRRTTGIIAKEFFRKHQGVVLKASGLAAGKGVFVCRSLTEVTKAIDMLYSDRLAEAARKVVIEEVVEGRECSFFTFLGRGQPHHLGFAVDFKRLKDGDQGPNTGGMGSYCPVPWLPADAEQQVIEQILTPLQVTSVIRGYVGCLYIGLMWTDSGPKVLEFNVRLGDPETQALVVGDKDDWLPIMANRAGDTTDYPVTTKEKKPTVAVVLSSPGYPYAQDNDSVRLPRSLFVNDDPDCQVFGASLRKDNDCNYLLTGSGRVLTVVASGQSHAEARQRVYCKVEEIIPYWRQAHFRTDIGEKVL